MGQSKETWQRAARGDAAAFEALVEEHKDKVFRHALRRLGSYEDAEDAAQEVFLRLHGALKSFRGEANLSTWIYSITANLCTDYLRKRGASPLPMSALENEEQSFLAGQRDPSPLPEERAEENELRERLNGALRALSDEHREILLQREVDGLSYEEMAKILRVPVGTVRSRLARARLALRKALEKYARE